MKKVINGKLYNTDTATCLGEYSNDYGIRDFNYVQESLYRTKARAYFLHGKGGGLTQYAISNGNNTWSGGEMIIPMSREAARKWAEEKLRAEEYMAVFNLAEAESSAKESINLSFSPVIIQKLEILSEETGKSISQLIEDKFM